MTTHISNIKPLPKLSTFVCANWLCDGCGQSEQSSAWPLCGQSISLRRNAQWHMDNYTRYFETLAQEQASLVLAPPALVPTLLAETPLVPTPLAQTPLMPIPVAPTLEPGIEYGFMNLIVLEHAVGNLVCFLCGTSIKMDVIHTNNSNLSFKYKISDESQPQQQQHQHETQL
jgi:hypothetical protein